MGDCQNRDLRVQFDRRLKLKFLGSKVTTDAGLLAYWELDEAIGLTEMSEGVLSLGSNKQHQLVPLLRQSIYSRLAGYEDVNDAEQLAIDPAMRHVVGGRATLAEKYAASTSEVGRFETEILSTKDNLKKLMDLSGERIDKVHQQRPLKELILDMDSSVSETYGEQEGSAYNGQRFPARRLGVGLAAGFNCSDWNIRKLDGSGEVLAACGGSGLVKAAGFSLPTLLSTTSAQTLSGTWQQTTRKLHAVVRRTDSRNSRSTT